MLSIILLPWNKGMKRKRVADAHEEPSMVGLTSVATQGTEEVIDADCLDTPRRRRKEAERDSESQPNSKFFARPRRFR
jgi:hypothetical protein